MALTLNDKEDIQKLIDAGTTLVRIAARYGVGEYSVRRYISDNRLDYVKRDKRKSVKTTRINGISTPSNLFGEPTHVDLSQRKTPHAQYLPQMHDNIPLPQSNDPQLLSYLLQLKTHEANTHKFNYAELEAKFKKLLDEHTQLSIDKTRFDKEKENAVKDALADKKGFDWMGALETVSNNPALSGVLAGVAGKLMNIPTDGQVPQLGAAPTQDQAINDYIVVLSGKDDETKRRLIAASFTLMDRPDLLNQLVPVIV